MLLREVRNGAIHLKWAQDSRSLLDAKPTDGILELRSHAVNGGRHLFSAQMPTEEGKQGILSENAIPPLFTGGSFI